MSDEAMFDAHCLALGKLCVAWAVIDRQLNDLLTALLGCSPAATACISTSADSVAARCEIIRRLVYEDSLSADWADDVAKLLARLGGEVARKRNRYLHDYWALSEGALVRMDRRASVAKPQSRKPLRLTYDAIETVAPETIERFTEQVGQMMFLLHCATRDAQDWRQHRMHAEPPLLSRALDLPLVPNVHTLLRE